MKKLFFLFVGLVALSLSSCLKVDDDAIFNGQLSKEQRAQWAKKASGHYNGTAVLGFDTGKMADKSASVSFSINGSDSTITVQDFPVSLLSQCITDNNRVAVSIANTESMSLTAIMHPVFLNELNAYTYLLAFKPFILHFDVKDVEDGHLIPVEVALEGLSSGSLFNDDQKPREALALKVADFDGSFEFRVPVLYVKVNGKEYKQTAFIYIAGAVEK